MNEAARIPGSRARIWIFGCGSAGRRAHATLAKRFEVVGFLDNNSALHGSDLLGVPVRAPPEHASIGYDRIFIASMYHSEIRAQLIHQLGIAAGRIELAPEFVGGGARREKLCWGNLRAHWRRALASFRFRDHPGLGRWMLPARTLCEGYQGRLARLRNRHIGEPLFLVAAGGSIQVLDPRRLQGFATVTCNGACAWLNRQGVASTYHIIEDRRELERRRSEWSGIRAGLKMTTLENADLVESAPDTIFFQTNRHPHDTYFWEDDPRPFSRDFAVVAYLGGTITYVMLQFAYHVGANPVILLGVDHTYGRLIKDLGVTVSRTNRSFLVTPENHGIFSRYHFDSDYFKVGDRVNLPSLDEQEHAFARAAAVFAQKGIRVVNANPASGLDTFEKQSLDEILARLPPGAEAGQGATLRSAPGRDALAGG